MQDRFVLKDYTFLTRLYKPSDGELQRVLKQIAFEVFNRKSSQRGSDLQYIDIG